VKRVNLRWWASFALFATLGLAWVIATPIFAAPDEPAHVIRAASVGRGELLGKKPPPERLIPPIGDAAVEVTAPATYNGVNITCFIWQKDVSADCMNFGGGSTRDIKVDTWVGHHNPAYYVPVGFLSRIVKPGSGQVFLMRAIGMLIVAALLASCLETLKRVALPIWASTGFAVAISPMVIFLASTVSPSGVEIGGAVGVWVHGAVLAKEAPDTIDGKLIDRLGIAMSILLLSRALSPLWVGVIGLVLLILTTRAGLLALAKSRRVWIWGGVLAACSAIQVAWFIYGEPLTHFVGDPVEASTPSLIRTSVGKTGEMLRQMVGVFGWLDTRAPGLTFFIWVIALGGIAVLAIALASKRFVWALLAATSATVVLPVIVESAGAHEAGFIWQGRYTLPLAVGVPLIAGIGVGTSERARDVSRRLGWVIAGALAVAHALAFAQALRRYAVGADGPLWFFPDARWEPPVPSFVLIVGYGLAITLAMWWIVLAPSGLLQRRDQGAPDEPTVAATDPPEVVDLGEAPVSV
jgi:hypothetical protein